MKANGTGNLFGMIGNFASDLIDQGADALGLSPEAKAAAKLGIGIFTGDVVTAAQGAAALASANNNCESPTATEMCQADIMASPAGYSHPWCGTATPPPGGTPNQADESSWAAFPTTGSTAQSSGSSHLDPNITGYQECLNTLLENWEVFDTAMGTKDCLITKENLEAISNFPNASAELKKAAQFLAQHQEYFNRLEMACGVGGKDGIISQGDVAADLEKVKKEIVAYGPPSAAATTDASSTPEAGSTTCAAQTSTDAQDIVAGGAGGSNPLTNPFTDSSLGIEDRIRTALERAMSSLDGKIEALAAAMGDNPSQKQMSDFQQLIERRTRMYTLMSDISAKFNEMSKTAIQNMARA